MFEKCPICNFSLEYGGAHLPEDGGMGYPMGPNQYCPKCGWSDDDSYCEKCINWEMKYIDGHPGEVLIECVKCGKIVDAEFNINSIK